jgi:hypothetical protein
MCPSALRGRSHQGKKYPLNGRKKFHATKIIHKTQIDLRPTFKTQTINPFPLKYWHLYSEEGSTLFSVSNNLITSKMVDMNITSSCWWKRCVSKTH